MNFQEALKEKENVGKHKTSICYTIKMPFNLQFLNALCKSLINFFFYSNIYFEVS